MSDLDEWTDEELLLVLRAVITETVDRRRRARGTPPLLTDPDRLNAKVAELNDVQEKP